MGVAISLLETAKAGRKELTPIHYAFYSGQGHSGQSVLPKIHAGQEDINQQTYAYANLALLVLKVLSIKATK